VDQKIGIATVKTSTLCSGKRMYLATVSNGNLGGKTGADAICNAQKPSGVTTAKAMIAYNVAAPNTRTPCGNTPTPPMSGGQNCTASNTYEFDWVFAANSAICTSDLETLVGTTNGFKTLTSVNTTALATSATTTFTGMGIYWGTTTGLDCSAWTSTSGTATVGSATSSGSGFVSTGSFYSCASAGTIYCVEQ
jgi:hypothetical protein